MGQRIARVGGDRRVEMGERGAVARLVGAESNSSLPRSWAS